jgi:hypothetical protein
MAWRLLARGCDIAQGRFAVSTSKRKSWGPDEDAPASSPGESTHELIRSLRRTTRDLEKALSSAEDSQRFGPTKSEAPSGIRTRVHSVLIVAEDNFSRALLTERLRNAGILVECASDPEVGLEQAHRSVPDVVIVDQAVNASSYRNVAFAAGRGRPARSPAVVTVEGSLVGRSAGRTFTVAQWRESAREIFEVVLAITRAAGGPG